MFGWEFPPSISGGLGVACEGLVRGLLELDTEVALVLPRRSAATSIEHLRIIPASEVDRAAHGRRGRVRTSLRVRRITTPLRPYMTACLDEGERRAQGRPGGAGGDSNSDSDSNSNSNYGPDLPRQVLRYAAAAGRIAARESFDVIHAHDWLTFLAGVEARRVSGKPLVLHVHATEFDRAGGRENGFVAAIERLGLAAADRVVAVSGYTAELLARRYGVAAERLRIVHNAIDPRVLADDGPSSNRNPLVLFAGRITSQKGPGFFVEAAARVAAERRDVRFVVAGSGDRMRAMRDHVAARGLRKRFLFTGFLPAAELDRLYARADVYVLPSVSEPFGLTALEALQHGTPVIVSRCAGVSEVAPNVLRVRFGDVDDLASKILSVLAFPPLREALSERGRADAERLSWRSSAARCVDVYRELVGESRGTP